MMTATEPRASASTCKKMPAPTPNCQHGRKGRNDESFQTGQERRVNHAGKDRRTQTFCVKVVVMSMVKEEDPNGIDSQTQNRHQEQSITAGDQRN